MKILRIIGGLWLIATAVFCLYLMLPVLRNPSRLSGPAGPEYIFPPLFFMLFLSLPGLLLLLIGGRRPRK